MRLTPGTLSLVLRCAQKTWRRRREPCGGLPQRANQLLQEERRLQGAGRNEALSRGWGAAVRRTRSQMHTHGHTR